jgi:adenylyltransferase/sulfurtransferase
MLSKEEKQRYSRHIILSEIGLEGQQKLKNSSVLVVGAGGLGCPALQYLAAAGVGKIGIVDFDTVDISNLQRQILFGTKDLGKNKALAAKDRLLENNNLIDIECFTEKIDSKNALEIIKNFDLVLDGSDNFATRYLLNDSCVLLGKPLVYGAIFKFEGQISVFNYQNGPSYRCLFPEQPKADEIPTCSQIGVLGVLPGIVGAMQATEAIKVLLGKKEVLSGRFLTIDVLNNNFLEIEFERIEENFKIDKLGTYEFDCQTITTKELSVDELSEHFNDYFLIDIRPQNEREICKIDDSHSITLEEIEDKISNLPRNRKIAVYCHFGNQSKTFVSLLTQKYGFKEVYNLTGGIHEWSQEIDSNVTVY